MLLERNCLCMPLVKNILKLRNKKRKILNKSCRENAVYLDLAKCAFAFIYPRSVGHYVCTGSCSFPKHLLNNPLI